MEIVFYIACGLQVIALIILILFNDQPILKPTAPLLISEDGEVTKGEDPSARGSALSDALYPISGKTSLTYQSASLRARSKLPRPSISPE
jgi:hypothetical protein